jgi:hypothetical protein
MVIYNFTGGFNMNILVCDDDREIVDAIEAYLKRTVPKNFLRTKRTVPKIYPGGFGL